ncbi:NAD(P)H-binding protein [Saccharospirillum mangrovi]|uniref:NAD(P)H-binding protein n=1 Tax=Saccharospirillum mangrovi TaxID=2161747 RepID=UPI000D3CE246|nr:NAD(P)H-binding protein [Saccharospirillum mangrovi]
MSATVLVGATGLIGQAVAARLKPNSFDPCWLLVRRDIAPGLPHQQIQVVDFKQLEQQTQGLDLTGGTLICTLGTTLRTAGSPEAFVAVDRDLVAQVAHWARDRGVTHCLAVSSLGANADSRNLYLRTKGQAEQELMALSFQRLTLMRPSLLLGERKEFRLGERAGELIGRVIWPLLVGPLRRYRPVEAEQVARVLVHQAASNSGPVIDIWESERINRWQPDTD